MSSDILKKNLFKIGEEIGRGAYGVVNKIIDTVENKIYALKQIDLSTIHTSESSEMDFYSLEYEIMSKNNLFNVVKARGSLHDQVNSMFYISMDFYPSDLRRLVRARGPLPFHQARSIFNDIVTGRAILEYIGVLICSRKLSLFGE